MTPLHHELELVCSTIAGSTAHRAQEVAAFVAQALQAQAARAQAGAESSRKRSQRLRSAIRAAAGLQPSEDGRVWAPLHLGIPSWPRMVADRLAMDPRRYGIAAPPCDDVIRAEWAALKIAASSVA